MSNIVDMRQFERSNVTPIDPVKNARLGLALLIGLDQPLSPEHIDNLEATAKAALAVIDSLHDMLNDIAFLMRIRGTSDWSIEKHLQRTCPLLACLYRIEALSAERIGCDTTAWAKLAEIRDLAVQGIEERMPDREFTNPVYPEREPDMSKAKRWRKLKEDMSHK